MAIIDGLTTLAAVKLEAGISDTSQDSTLEALINSCSAAIGVICDRTFKKTTYTAEPYSVNAHQYLYLRNYPVQAVSAVTVAGNSLVLNTDYFLDARDAEAGRLYKPSGWMGMYWSRGTFPDPFAGARNVLVTYEAGYLLPADVGYSAGGATSLPLALTYACTRAVMTRFRTVQNQADGLKQLSEGGLSYTWFGPENVKAGSGGFDSVVMEMLAPFRRREAF